MQKPDRRLLSQVMTAVADEKPPGGRRSRRRVRKMAPERPPSPPKPPSNQEQHPRQTRLGDTVHNTDPGASKLQGGPARGQSEALSAAAPWGDGMAKSLWLPG